MSWDPWGSIPGGTTDLRLPHPHSRVGPHALSPSRWVSLDETPLLPPSLTLPAQGLLGYLLPHDSTLVRSEYHSSGVSEPRPDEGPCRGSETREGDRGRKEGQTEPRTETESFKNLKSRPSRDPYETEFGEESEDSCDSLSLHVAERVPAW